MIATTLFSYLMTTATLLSLQHPADTLVGSLTSPVYFEPADSGQIVFYFDDQYYLSDKDCQYTNIHRYSLFNAQDGVFEGQFEDYDLKGNVVLEGNYQHGNKTGLFRAYHSNGKIKWEGSFEDNKPTGLWHYFYPDGQPMQEVQFDNNQPSLTNFWDTRGRQQVTSGEGNYKFSTKENQYNEYGYTFLQSSGKVKNGQPNGTWKMVYLFPDGKNKDAGVEKYENGVLVSGYDAFAKVLYNKKVRANYIPPESFAHSERLIGKNCTVDEHEGFTQYLQKRLNDYFSDYKASLKESQHVIVKVKVNKSGLPQDFIADSTFDNARPAHTLLRAFQSIPYWIPSYINSEYIEDILIISADAIPSMKTRRLEFYNVHIKREKGM